MTREEILEIWYGGIEEITRAIRKYGIEKVDEILSLPPEEIERIEAQIEGERWD